MGDRLPSRERTSDTGAIHAALVHAQSSVRRLTRLADDLVVDVRIRHGRLALRLEPCDLVTIVAGVVAEQRAAESDRMILLEVLGSGSQPGQPAPSVPVLADADRIAQVVTNYLTNALKYSAAECPVTIHVDVVPGVEVVPSAGQRTGGPGALACVSVHDEGIGVPLAEQAQVWERFHVVEGNTVQSGSGTSLGLGLHISKAIVEEHRGQVGLTSDPSISGMGSTFWFMLPLALPTLASAPSAASPGAE